MATLHSSWILEPPAGYLFIWGETWRAQAALASVEVAGAVPTHPFALTPAELLDLLERQFPDFGRESSPDWPIARVRAPRAAAARDAAVPVRLPCLSSRAAVRKWLIRLGWSCSGGRWAGSCLTR
ncbi:MAG: hypothetical protein HC838_03460 [Spirulinaceae cyanobacterium RM2_2_10]|nr:hypothetical protein [Spirulinaceae cyanobacterium RM2_2_10]